MSFEAHESFPLLFLPLIVASAELAVPPLRGLEVGHLAEPLGLNAYFLLGEEHLAVDFGVESELHLAISGSSASFLALTAIFLPSEQVAPRDSVLLRDLLGIDTLQNLSGKCITCLTASSFSATVYLR